MNTFLKITAICIALLLTACGTTKELIIEQIDVPIPVYCNIVSPSKPVWPMDGLSKDESDIFVIIKHALADIELRKGYETELEAAIAACNSK